MKICYLCADRGIPINGTKGASAHVRDLVRAFLSLGHEVQVLAASPGDGDPGFPCTSIPYPRIMRDFPGQAGTPLVRALGHLWNNSTVETTLEKAIERFQPDIVYERYSPFGVAGGIVSASLGVRHILEVNAPLAWEGSRYRNQAMTEAARLLEATAFDATSLLVVVSRELKQLLVDEGVDASRIRVVPNGVDAERFNNRGKTERAASDDRLIIGFVGSLKPWHGIKVLARAFRALAPQGKYHLLVVGDGPEAREVRTLREEFPGLVTHVKSVPHSQVPRYLRGVDVAVAPYPVLDRFYFSPLKVLEYMAAGRAIVASSVGQVQELITSGETGLLVPPGDAEALAAAVSDLYHQPGRRRVMGEAAAAVARRSHLWMHRAEDILSLAGAPVS